jgi:hypothetical protein
VILSRRRVLAGIGAFGASAAISAPAMARLAAATPIRVEASPIAAFSPSEPDRRQFGGLQFRSGLQLSSPDGDFGGLSGLWRAPDGAGLVAVSDRGHWLTARLRREAGRLAAVDDAQLAPLLRSDGRPLNRTRSWDVEGLAITGGIALVSIERTQQVMRFDFGKEGVLARGRELPVPREFRRLPSNKGLEAIAVAPQGHPLAGAVIVVSERSGEDNQPTMGAIITGPRAGLFEVSRPGDYDITDMAFLPDGDLLLLERWFRPFRGLGMRIRRVPGQLVAPGAMLDGPVLIEADLGREIDNMEGIAIHQEDGRTLITLVSDDNFSMLQRTILLEFELA